MTIFDTFRNYLNAIIGSNQEFEKLLDAGDISAIQKKMTIRKDLAARTFREYDTRTHEINKRPDKEIRSRKGDKVRMEKVWKLPIPYPVYINEIALVFMYGRPVKWVQRSEGTDDAFQKFCDVIDRTSFNAKIRQCKRLAGAETESAMLFRVFRDDDGKADVQIRVLAASKGDEIYTRWDQYENLAYVAWGYHTREEEDKDVYHFDLFSKDKIYRCVKEQIGWSVVAEDNLIGKIPIILFQQEKEWEGVENLIYREEYIASTTADTNDYFSDPALVASADIVKNLPEKGERGKVFVTNSAAGVGNAIDYLTWDSAPESKKQELEWLQDKILTMSFTPKITLDTLKSVSQLSGKALKTVMLLADIKASRHKESHDDLLRRAGSLIKAIIGNVLDVSMHGEMEKLKLGHEFQEPFGDDIAETINNIVKAVDGGVLSSEGGIELNPLVKDAVREKERIDGEKQALLETTMNVFDDSEGAKPGSAN